MLQKAKKSKVTPKADTWPGEEQLMKDIEGIVEDITGGDGYIKLGAVYNALGILPPERFSERLQLIGQYLLS